MDIHNLLSGKRPTWVEVNLRHLDSNLSEVRKKLGEGIKIIAVVKADAYGHGSVPVAQRLEERGVDAFAVAILEEALPLRAAGIKRPILLLNGYWTGQEHEIIRQELTPAVFGPEMVQVLARTGKQLGKRARYHLKLDTGMSRLGLDWDKVAEAIPSCLREEWAICEGFYTHLSSAEDADNTLNYEQIKRFRNIVRAFPSNKASTSRWHHVANSAAIFNFPDCWLDGVRPGLVLYGINPLDNPLEIILQPALSFRTRIAQLRYVKKGTSIGYGGLYTAQRESLIAILPVGYADGLPRCLSNKGYVLVRNRRVPIVGRISMDLTVADVSEVGSVQAEDEVVLIGRQGTLEITAKEVAGLAETIPYEVISRISSRVPRIHLNS